MDAQPTKKARQPNFSTTDCLLLAEMMGTECGFEGLTFHAHAKHKYTPSITAVSKHEVMSKLTVAFNLRADVKLDSQSLQKKWDNLTQTHRSCYADHRHSISKTGGGPAAKPLSPLTEAVMSVIGRNSQNVIGIHAAEELDSSTLLLANHNNSTNTVYDSSLECSLGNSHILTFSDNEEPLYPIDSIDIITGPIVGPAQTLSSSKGNTICCKCGCHKRVEELKELKLKLQIRVLKGNWGLKNRANKM